MPQVTIDGQTFEFEEGERLLQFCLDRGHEIPHFCYHPAMTAPANCRQCLVKAGTPAKDRETGELVLEEDLPAPRPDVYYVYAIACEGDEPGKTGSHYIGHTDDLQRRWQDHLSGKGAEWTKNNKPLRIAHYEEFGSREEAVAREKELKTTTGRRWLKNAIAEGRARQAGGSPKINYIPKLQTGCTLEMTDGMVVHTQRDSAEVNQAQTDNLEMMLINHPLDCPICDQAGECPLQIQAYKYGPEGSRFEFDKIRRPKRVRLGPHVVLDAERCINCTRCTRFTEEISESNQLSIINRGAENYPMPAPGEAFDEPYSMNVTDICPVGALTEEYFRFKARVWEMSRTPTISDFDGTGINITVWVRDNQVLRIKPRENLEVNDYWMPDATRLVYSTYNEDRLSGPRMGNEAVSWEEAQEAAADLLRTAGENVLFVGSPLATVEDNAMLARLAEATGAKKPVYLSRNQPGTGDGWLASDDKAPNTQGCERLGLRRVDPGVLPSLVEEVNLVYILQEDPVAMSALSEKDLEDKPVILHATHTTNETLPQASVALPIATSVETIGTYVNEKGRAQRLRPAKMIRSMNRRLLMAMGTGVGRTDAHGTPFDRWHDESHKVDCLPGWETLPSVAATLGHDIGEKNPKTLMAHLAEINDAFAGATYEAMGLHGVDLEEIRVAD